MAKLGLDLYYLGGFWRFRVMADDEFGCVDHYLDDLLKGDAALTTLLTGGFIVGEIWGDRVLEGATFPCASAAFFRAEEDDRTFGNAMQANLVYRIGAWSQSSSYAPIRPIVARMKLLLNTKPPARDDGEIVSCTRLMPTRDPYSKDY